MVIGLMASGAAQAGSTSANLTVSVTVSDQCLIHTDSRSASCAGGSAYAVGVGRERIDVTRDQLTAITEHVHTTLDGSRLSQSVAGTGGQRGVDLVGGAVRTVAETVVPVDAIRVTYSF